MAEPSRIVGPTELAAFLGLSRQMVYKYERLKKIPARTNGGWDPEAIKLHLAGTVGTKRGGVPRTGDRDEPAIPKHHAVSHRPVPRKEPKSESDESSASKSRVELENAVLIERAEKLRLENEVSRGTLVNASDIESATEARFRADAEAILSWPTSVAAEMAAELGIHERILFPVLDRYVRQFMRERGKAEIPVAT